MSEKDFELYLYSLRKMAEANADSNLSFMTNLYTLPAFQYKAGEEMLEHPTLKYALIVLDLANFKSINEFCGREAGDGLLNCVADALREHQKEHVLLSHFRADTFGMLTPFEKEDELINIVQEIDAQISSYKIAYRALPAFGICIAESPTMSVSLMRDYATLALNTIKGKFYAKYAFFNETMHREMLMNKMIENDIVTALENNQICLYIQPKVNMQTGEIIGGEALVRWQHPEKGLIPPNDFIPLLEKNGLVIDVDIHVWTQVFRFLGTRLKEGKKIVPISINISRMHIYDKTFRKCLVDLAKEYQVPPEYVPLELTESGFLENSDIMYDHMKYLKDHGFSISMDDFGTGYSTMAMLRTQPVDEVKIDRGFITDIADPKCQSVIKHTVDLIRDLDMDVIVEGVEDPAQQQFLLECGCTSAQGFLYYHPIPVADFEKLL
jgi:diguanylate cyclase (GGDEF)-like protein